MKGETEGERRWVTVFLGRTDRKRHWSGGTDRQTDIQADLTGKVNREEGSRRRR